ncbi:MAG: GNAT family N-acetyltransferase [Oscillospiraceae bacterium]|nr:GNAT family N-acetyltransferase [Oscillospiraceae bacterium]
MNPNISLNRPQSLLQWFKIYRLYCSAFPVSERKPFSMITSMYRKGTTDVWYCSDDGKFVGIAITINGTDSILLDYFAMDKHLRGKGYGSAILNAVIKHYSPKTVFGEIETVFEDCDDLDMRIRRKQFYLRNGLKEMGVMVYLFGVKMELLTSDRSMSFEEYRNFYRDNYNQWAADHISPADHPYDTGGDT